MLKLYCFVLTAVLSCSVALADPPEPAWSATFDNGGTERAFAICLAPDGGVVATGFAMPSTTYGPFTVRVSTDGGEVWRTQNPPSLWTAGTYYCRAIAPAFDSGFVCAGPSFNTALAPFMFKLNPNGDSVWTQLYTAWSGMDLRGLVQAADSSYIAAGTYNSDVLVFKTNLTGNSLWSRSFGGTLSDSGMAMLAMPDGGATVAGSNANQAYLARLNAGGDTLWTRTFGQSTYNSAGAIDRTADNGFILAGVSDSLTPGGEQVFMVLTDSAGTALWQRHYALRGAGYTCGASAVRQTPDGNFVIAGWTHAGATTDYDAFLAGVNSVGDTLWTLFYGGPDGDRFKALTLAADGGFYAAGYLVNSGAGTDNMFVMRFPPQSGVQGTVRDELNQLVTNARVWAIGQQATAQTDAFGHYQLALLAGTYDLICASPCTERDTIRNVVVEQGTMTNRDWQIARPHVGHSPSSLDLVVHDQVTDSATVYLHNSGVGLLEYSLLAVPQDPVSNWLSVSSDGGMIAAHDSVRLIVYVLADTARDHTHDYLGNVRVHSNSCPDSISLITVGATVLVPNAANLPAILPTRYDVAVYPNPFNPVTTISLSLPKQTRVSLRLYDMLGREVRTLCDGVLQAGVQRIAIDASGLPTGLYFARVQTSEFTRTQKLMLMK